MTNFERTFFIDTDANGDVWLWEDATPPVPVLAKRLTDPTIWEVSVRNLVH